MMTARAQSSEIRAQRNDDQRPAFTSGSYRNLKIWQRAIELSIAVYKLTGGFPREEMFGLISQLRRAAVSTASNIAEGYGRASRGEFRQFVGMARGSVLEPQT